MKKKMKQSISIFLPIFNLGDNSWQGELDKLPANQTFKLIINYPFGGERIHTFPIKTGKRGLGLVSLLDKIGSAYHKLYEDPVGNGVFGHDIYDLCLEGINVDFKNKTITLSVGS